MRKKLKIAVFELSRISETGGGQKVAAKVAEHLSKKHYVEVFTQKPPKKNLNFGNSKITLIKPSNRFLAIFAFFKKVKDFDLVITGEFPSNLVNLRNKNSINICCTPPRELYDLREYLFRNSNFNGKMKILIKNMFFRYLDLIAVKKTTKFLAISKTVQERIRKYYSRNSKIFYPGIKFEKYKFRKYGNYILSVSRLVGPKRVDLLIKSMGFVKNKKVKLYVVGEGKERDYFKELCKKYSNVKYIGLVSENKLINLYADCLALAYIPMDEDWGLVPIEAGASKKATIGVKEGGLRETIIDGKTGFLLNEVSPKEIARKIDFLMNNKDLARKMGISAFHSLKKFDWDNTLRSLDLAVKEVSGFG